MNCKLYTMKSCDNCSKQCKSDGVCNDWFPARENPSTAVPCDNYWVGTKIENYPLILEKCCINCENCKLKK